jgi:signal peptidase I
MKDHRFKKYFKYVALNVLIAATVSILLINYVASAYKIKGHSMRSVLKDQERVIISKLGIRNGNIKRFDIVVLNKPNEPGKSVVKRVIGLPGEIIEIKEGDVYINYKKLEQPFLSEKESHSFQGDNMKPLLIREDHYFVLGDNRAVSHDSRSFGTVPEKYIYGKTIFRYWPLTRFGTIK